MQSEPQVRCIGIDKRKPIWTPEMKAAASRSGKLLKKLMAALAQSREAHNDALSEGAGK